MYVQVSAAYLYAGWMQEQLLADRCSAEALRLAASCVLVHAVRRLVRPEHNSPRLGRCSKVYGMAADEMVNR